MPETSKKIDQKDKIKVAMCCTSFEGGIKTYVKNILGIKKLHESIDFSVIKNIETKDDEVNDLENVFPKEEFKFSSRNKLKILKTKTNFYLKNFKDIEPEIIYINFSTFRSILPLVFAAKKYKKSNIILHAHTSQKQSLFFKSFVLTYLGHKNVTFLGCSDQALTSFYGKKYSKNNIDKIVSNSINSEKFEFNLNDRNLIRSELNLKDSDIVLGFVGRFHEIKNLSFLIEILSKFPTNYHLLLVGDGPEHENLSKLVAQKNLSERVIFVPFTNESWKYYSAFDFFVLPSLLEGLPFTAIEAQANGLPCFMSKNITLECSVSSNLKYLSLEEDLWVKNILEYKRIDFKERKELNKNVAKSKFESSNNAEQIYSILKEASKK